MKQRWIVCGEIPRANAPSSRREPWMGSSLVNRSAGEVISVGSGERERRWGKTTKMEKDCCGIDKYFYTKAVMILVTANAITTAPAPSTSRRSPRGRARYGAAARTQPEADRAGRPLRAGTRGTSGSPSPADSPKPHR
jgi:hypothetical protein